MSHDLTIRRHPTRKARQVTAGSRLVTGESILFMFLSDLRHYGTYDMVIFLPFISVEFLKYQ